MRESGLPMALLALAACSASPPADVVALGRQPVYRALRAMSGQQTAVVAHRGASAVCPENTLAAFRRAVEVGAAVVELDVYQTSDGVWVCMHDATCDRTSNARALFGRVDVRVDELTFTQVQRLDAGSWFGEQFAGEPVPTLAEAIAVILPRVPMIERKGGDARALVDELARVHALDHVLVQAFDWDWLAAVHGFAPQLLLAALGGGEPSTERLADIGRTGASIVHWNHAQLDVDAAEAIRQRQWLLCVYTVDSHAGMLGSAALGCHMITTNRPARALELQRRGLLRRLPAQ